MIIFKNPSDIHLYIAAKKQAGFSTAFVPTMGALHSGHTDLVAKAKAENQLVICSIFVNPTQFNDAKDFEKYPSTIENDLLLLEKTGCDIVFIPSQSSIYPDGLQSLRHYELGYLETILEGKYRPGHFQGVCQVVHRLLEIVHPHKLYLGQKDFQQCMVLNKMVRLLKIDTEIIIAPTRREADGLAMSSRNMRLNETERKTAPAIYQALSRVKRDLKPGDTTALTRTAKQSLTDAGFKVDYVAIAAADTLELLRHWDGELKLVALAAAYLNEVRLIDNILLGDG